MKPETIERIRALAATGLRRREVAEQVSVPFSTLARMAARHKIEFHGKPATIFRIGRVAAPKRITKPIIDTKDEIARYIAERGVTRCPPAYAAPSPQGART